MTSLALTACDSRAPAPQAPAADAPAAKAKERLRSGWPFLEAGAEAASKPVAAPLVPVATADLSRRNYYIVFDASGSMLQSRCAGDSNKLAVAKQAVLRFASRLGGDSNVGLHVFDEQGIRQLLPLGALDQAELQRQVESIRAGGGTPLAESTAEAYAVLTAQARKQLGYGEYHLVIVTDGEATGNDPRPVIDRIVAESPVLVNTIGFCLSEQHSLNQPGRTMYRSADNPAALEQNLADVLAEAPDFDLKRFETTK